VLPGEIKRSILKEKHFIDIVPVAYFNTCCRNLIVNFGDGKVGRG
jgi:hypothetical protein